jgi:hypothetical protein
VEIAKVDRKGFTDANSMEIAKVDGKGFTDT